MDLLVELLGGLVFAIFGACFEIVWPAKTPEWTRWQKFGILLALTSILCGAAVFLIDGGVAWKRAEPTLIVVTIITFIGYLIVGNICRKFHE